MIWCKLIQSRIRWAEQPANLNTMPQVAGHLQRCPACRAYHRHIVRMEDGLHAAPAQTIAPQDCKRIETAILNRLAQTERTTGAATRPIAFPRPTKAIAAAAMVLVATALLVRHNRPHIEPPPETPAPTVLWSASQLPTVSLTELVRMPDRSIHNEMNNLTQDARRAVVFLLNCTPSHPLPELDNGT